MRLSTSYIQGLITGGALALTVPLLAGVDLPNTFEPGTTASAEQVNANFNALADRIEAMEMFVSDLETYMEVTENGQGTPVIRISGANVHINNGAGTTDSVNGAGNLVIGYDELREDGDPVCSNGRYDNQGDCESAGSLWATDHKSGSHNLVIGAGHNYSQYGGLVAGEANTINGRAATVSGGNENTAADQYAAVSGGRQNTAGDTYASVSGGWNNTADHLHASVSGGRDNVAGGVNSAVSGGYNNNAAGDYTSVTGGRDNAALGEYSGIVGGESNTTNGDYAVVTTGFQNVAGGNHAGISGGHSNVTNSDRASILGGYGNLAVGEATTVAGGFENEARGNGSTVGGGNQCVTTDVYEWLAVSGTGCP